MAVCFDAGVDALNDSREVTYAISSRLAVPVPPHIPPGKAEKLRIKQGSMREKGKGL